MWFHNSKPSEMLMGINGLSSTRAVLDSEFPERIVSAGEMRNLQFLYIDAKKVLKSFDHITCHPDGTFHIRTRDEDLYVHQLKRVEALGRDTPVFFEFIVLSDRGRFYASTTDEPKAPCLVLKIQRDATVQIMGAFSGARYDLESVFAGMIPALGGEAGAPAFRLRSGTLKGMLYWQVSNPPEAIFSTRPRGTLFLIRFPVGADRFLVKSFLFT
jgi:hypothetical protein